MVEETKETNKEGLTKSDLISFAFELGGAIAIPLVILGFGGRLLDKYLNSSPLFLICGLLLSLVTTSIAITRKVKKISKL